MRAKRSLVESYPIVCPFCDELAYLDPTEKARVSPYKIIQKRKCIMGHEIYSVEEVPEDQSAIVDEIREFEADMREWKAYVRRERAKNYDGKRGEFKGKLPSKEQGGS